MKTIFIAGTDTGIGKTRVLAVLAALLPDDGESVQIVKPVETGVSPDSTDGDAAYARGGTRRNATAHTLRRFKAPLAPLAAAREAGETFDPCMIAEETRRLPSCDWRLIEGAGGLAVPLRADGFDWADFAPAAGAGHTVLVVPDRLGAINQARLAVQYARSKGLAFSLWLNEFVPAKAEVRAANREGLDVCGIAPLFRLKHNADAPEEPEAVRAYYRNLPCGEGNSRSTGKTFDNSGTPSHLPAGREAAPTGSHHGTGNNTGIPYPESGTNLQHP